MKPKTPKPSMVPQTMAQLKSRPVAPPVYRPQIPKVLQPKNVLNQSRAEATIRRPVGPPAFRPQPTPKVLQTKKPDGPPRSATRQATREAMPAAVAPPVYKPQPPPRVLQTRSTSGVARVVRPGAIQRKVVFTSIGEDGTPKARKFKDHPDEVNELHDMIVRAYPRLAGVENVKPKILSLINDRTTRESLFDVAQSLMKRDVRYMAEPDFSGNLIIGESHSDPTAREYVKRLLPSLKAKGYKFLGYEFFGGVPVGNVFDPRFDPSNDSDETTLQQAFDNALKNASDEVLNKVEEQGGNMLFSHCTAALGALFRQALALGIRVVALDYDPMSKVKPKDRIKNYDNHAADILNSLGGKWIAISGAAHLSGLVAKTGATPIDLS